MKPYHYTTLLSLILLLGHGQLSAQEQSEWTGGKLKWKHFRKVKDDDEVFKANLSYAANDASDTLDAQIKIDFKLVVNSEHTWVKQGHLTKHLLIHEQAHLYIAELELRKLKQQLRQNPLLLNSYDSLLTATKSQEDFVQRQFDRETAFGTRRELNKTWFVKIKKELKSLRKYRKPVYLQKP